MAQTYAADTGDRNRMHMLLDPTPEAEPEAQAIREPSATPSGGEGELASHRGQRVDLSEANTGQLNSAGRRPC